MPLTMCQRFPPCLRIPVTRNSHVLVHDTININASFSGKHRCIDVDCVQCQLWAAICETESTKSPFFVGVSHLIQLLQSFGAPVNSAFDVRHASWCASDCLHTPFEHNNKDRERDWMEVVVVRTHVNVYVVHIHRHPFRCVRACVFLSHQNPLIKCTIMTHAAAHSKPATCGKGGTDAATTPARICCRRRRRCRQRCRRCPHRRSALTLAYWRVVFKCTRSVCLGVDDVLVGGRTKLYVAYQFC